MSLALSKDDRLRVGGSPRMSLEHIRGPRRTNFVLLSTCHEVFPYTGRGQQRNTVVISKNSYPSRSSRVSVWKTNNNPHGISMSFGMLSGTCIDCQ